MDVPLILTVAMEENAFLFFNSLRKIYFPAERNLIEAHLTLFHFLPPDEALISRVAELASQTAPIQMEVVEPVSIGNGVAYSVRSEQLVSIHRELQKEWDGFLIPQDKQKFRPHVTVQNKVGSVEVAELLQFLKDHFSSFTFTGTGLQVWEYHGGPWKLYRQFNFTSQGDFSNLNTSQNAV